MEKDESFESILIAGIVYKHTPPALTFLKRMNGITLTFTSNTAVHFW